MATEIVQIRSAQVVRDAEKTWRWYDAWGPGVIKWEIDGFHNVVSTTTVAGSTVTVTNGTIVTGDSVTGGSLVLTLGGADNDKVEIQSRSEGFYFANRWPAYYGCKFSLVDVDQSDVHAGFVIRDTDMAGGVSDALCFRVVDESAAINLLMEKDSAESTTSIVASGVDATVYTLEMYYDGDYVYSYLNGTLIASDAVSGTNFPDDEHLTATIATQAGENSANHMTLYWARAIQVQEA